MIRWEVSIAFMLMFDSYSGRALDTAPPALYTLMEINKSCPEILTKCEVRPGSVHPFTRPQSIKLTQTIYQNSADSYSRFISTVVPGEGRT